MRGTGGIEGRGEDGGGGGSWRDVEKSGRDNIDGVSGGKAGGRIHVEDCGTYTEREREFRGIRLV